MKANGGLITKADLAAYEAKVRTPVRGTYRGYEIVSMPPPSSGGVALIEMLNILEPFDLKAKGLLTAPALHLQIEAMRRAYLDRARYLGDPDFVEVPVARLTSKEYAKTRRRVDRSGEGVEQRRARQGHRHRARAGAGRDDALLRDRSRTAWPSRTPTRSKAATARSVVVKGAGFILNNEMGDFNKKPGETNARGDIGTPANLIAPGKRMLSSMTPTIVAEGRQAGARDRIAGRPHDHQHRARRSCSA